GPSAQSETGSSYRAGRGSAAPSRPRLSAPAWRSVQPAGAGHPVQAAGGGHDHFAARADRLPHDAGAGDHQFGLAALQIQPEDALASAIGTGQIQTAGGVKIDALGTAETAPKNFHFAGRQHAVDRVKARSRGAAHVEIAVRSEEHTSELQSRENLVCRLLLEKKK